MGWHRGRANVYAGSRVIVIEKRRAQGCPLGMGGQPDYTRMHDLPRWHLFLAGRYVGWKDWDSTCVYFTERISDHCIRIIQEETEAQTWRWAIPDERALKKHEQQQRATIFY